MQEFSSISVSTYDPDALAGELNERAKDGWDVVAIVPTGNTVTAYLSREATDLSREATDLSREATDLSREATDDDVTEADTPVAAAVPIAAAELAAETEPEPETEPDAPDLVEESAPEPTPDADETEGFPAVAAVAAEPAAEASPAVPTAAEPATAEPAAAAAPAGWYADPSSRFELRYWDGSTWTEHVSRGGQQFTDPPVA